MRTLLIVTTLAAIGIALWTRWPYAAEEKLRLKLWREAAANTMTDQQGNAWSDREVAYFRRLLAGDRVRHGQSELFVAAGQRVVQRHFREGMLHGPYREFYTSGATRSEGEFFRGRKHGTWLLLGQPEREQANTDFRITQQWDYGVPHGAWQWEDGYGTVYLKATYDRGRVTHVDGTAVVDWLDEICRTLPAGKLADDWRTFHRTQANGGYPDWMQEVATRGVSVQIEYDPLTPQPNALEHFRKMRSVPYAIELAQELQRTNCAATRRYNCLLITARDRIGAEHDPTGVSQLQPSSDSLLAGLFLKHVKLDYREANFNLRQALNYLHKQVGLPLDDTALHGTLEPRDEDRAWIHLSWYHEEHNVRDLLGLALHRGRCRCELRNGQVIITRQ